MTWATSPSYGSSVALGPTQQAVYRYVMGMTEGGRRPYLTLATIAASVGKPVSSVHDALGRLRALGLIGCAARMGRTGGHRLWRATVRLSGRVLDPARHRRAVARILRRWPVMSFGPATLSKAEPVPRPQGDPVTPPTGPPSPFHDAMRRAGFRPWWESEVTEHDEHEQSDDRATDQGSGLWRDVGAVVDTRSPSG